MQSRKGYKISSVKKASVHSYSATLGIILYAVNSEQFNFSISLYINLEFSEYWTIISWSHQISCNPGSDPKYRHREYDREVYCLNSVAKLLL